MSWRERLRVLLISAWMITTAPGSRRRLKWTIRALS